MGRIRESFRDIRRRLLLDSDGREFLATTKTEDRAVQHLVRDGYVEWEGYEARVGHRYSITDYGRILRGIYQSQAT